MFYLKYRPQKIADLDNNRIKETLGKALLNDDFSHAYLLIGTRGSGKTTTARLIAKIVNCTGRKKGEEPCNQCDSCLGVTNGTNIDVVEIDAASNTGVDDIRELREKVKLSPSFSKYKVYIIDEVHMLSTSAFNALLKTLEEPPKHVIFVLATTDPQKLPQTIISRCLVYDFGKATTQEILLSLEKKVKSEKLDISPEKLNLIAKLANGSFRDGDKLLEQVSRGEDIVDINKIESAALEILELTFKKEGKEAVLKIEEFILSGGRIKELISGMLILLREKMIEGDKEATLLTQKIVEMYSLIKESPIEELPLEMVIMEYCQDGGHLTKKNTTHKILNEEVSVNNPKPILNEEKNKDTFLKEEIELPKIVLENASDLTAKWPEIINSVKPYNFNLSALLKSTKPIGIENDFLIIEAFYKFHKDKLSEDKNKQILEKAISGILGRELKVKFILKEV